MKQSVLGLGFSLGLMVSMLPQAEAGEHYWMADLGALWLDESKYDPDLLPAARISYGYAVNLNWAFELDYLRNIGGGSYSRKDNNENGEFSLWMSSLSVNYRHLMSSSFYLKGNLAYNYSEEHRSSSLPGESELNVLNTGAFGLGAGFLLGDVVGSSLTAEIEYTYYSNDMMGLMLGANITF